MRQESATFAAGCFWGVEDTFRHTPGVLDVVVGYTGGHTKNPIYEEVCTDLTGHAEAAQVLFDGDVISYEKLLDVFWNLHDPTTVNAQGPDIGSQYRSVIFYHTEVQKRIAEESKISLEKSKKYQKPIATVIEKAETFYPAEEYHQRYVEKTGKRVC
ncbi:MAG: peptide-methionine (S)-S-oxide reductase MsrA [Patescibacteria group bacterium]